MSGGQCLHALFDRRAALQAVGNHRPALGCHHGLERGPNLGTEFLLFRCEVQMHRSAPRFESYRHPFDAGDHGRPHAVDVTDQFELRISLEQYLEEDNRLESGQLRADA